MKQWELKLKDHACELLAESGVTLIDRNGFNSSLGLYPSEFLAFIKASQPDEWIELCGRYSSKAHATNALQTALVASLNERGTVTTLREGFVVHGLSFQTAYFRPANEGNAKTLACYQHTRVRVAKEVLFRPNSKDALDMVIFVNGIPTAAIELKSLLSANNETDATEQIRDTRKPDCWTLSHRVSALFSVNESSALMTPRADGAETIFTPFDQGYEGHAGNPPATNNERSTDYLWNWIFARDTWLWIIQMLVKEESPNTTADNRPRITFPWYHQIECIDRLVNAIRTTGNGGSYLIQHSTGSGKSNTIAGAIHALSLAHNTTGAPVFDKIVLISPRLNIDKQLGGTPLCPIGS